MRNDYKCSFAQFDITPNLAVENPSYGTRRSAAQIQSPLALQMLLVEDTNYTKILLVCADIIGFDPSAVKLVRDYASSWGIRPEGVILNASHNHDAPGTVSNTLTTLRPFFKNYTNQLTRIIVDNLGPLYASLESCTIHFGVTRASVGVNRRKVLDGKASVAPNRSGAYLTETPVIKLDLLKSKKRILLVNHGCHPAGVGPNRRISAGYPGYVREALVNNRVADGVMFLQGAAGSSEEAVVSNGETRFCKMDRDSRRNGTTLARRVLHALDQKLQPVKGPLFCTRQAVDLPLDNPLDRKTLQKIVADKTRDPGLREWAQNLSKQYPRAEFPKTVSFEMQFIALGGTFNILALPAEPPAELVLALKSAGLLAGHDLVLGYTNGLIGYLPTDEMIREGGYEVEQSHLICQQPAAFGPGVEKNISRALTECLDRKGKSDQPNGYGRYHLATGKKQAFFVLSAGRCGTMTLARVLDTAPNANVWHHPQPDPIKEALLAWWKEIDRSRCFWRSRAPIIHNSWANGKIHGETDLLMTPFCDVIAEEIPDAKFIVLVRDPRDFVRSGMRRNYYKNHSWDFGRLRPKSDSAEYANWQDLDQFEKICWLWAATYQEIQTKIRSIKKDNLLVLRLEDFINDPTGLEPVFEFLGLEGFDEVAIRTVLSKKLNQQRSGDFTQKEEWPERLHRQLWKQCGSLAESYGYQYDGFDRGEKKPNRTTIWDYLKYDHQSYPEKPNVDILLSGPKPDLRIDQLTRIVSMGSCFARNIALELMRRKFNYIVTELPFGKFSAHWGEVFNTACMRQIFEYTFSDRWNPVCRWWPKDEQVQDPFRRNVLYERETCEQAFAAHKQASSKALKNADIVILTLGLIETWRDKRDGMTYYRVPSPSIFNEEIHEFHVQRLEECVDDLNGIRGILKENNQNCQLIISVSPVPLFATFRRDIDVVSANTISKATLRVAAEYFCGQHRDVFYFPSYEIVTQMLDNPWEPDGRHVTQRAIAGIMDAFLGYFGH